MNVTIKQIDGMFGEGIKIVPNTTLKIHGYDVEEIYIADEIIQVWVKSGNGVKIVNVTALMKKNKI